jgi:hypothetical protein
MTNMATNVQTKKPAKTGDQIYLTTRQISTILTTQIAKNLKQRGKSDTYTKKRRQGTTEKVETNLPLEMSGSHSHRGGLHKKREKPAPYGNWESSTGTQTRGSGAQKTPTPQILGFTALGQILTQEDRLTVSHLVQNGLLSQEQAPRGKTGSPRLTPGFFRRRPALNGLKVSEVSREPVSMSVVRNGALWPDTLTPAPQTKTTGVVPVGRGVAPRSCSPGTPRRGEEHPTRPFVDGATGPEGAQVRVEIKVSTARRVDSGDYIPQDRRRTNIGLLQNREQCFQTEGGPTLAPETTKGINPLRQ